MGAPPTSLDTLRLALVVIGYGTQVFVLWSLLAVVVIALVGWSGPELITMLIGGFIVLGAVVIDSLGWIRRALGDRVRMLADAWVLGFSTIWALLLNSAAHANELGHALAEPEVLGVAALHALAALGYLVSRVQPRPLARPAEVVVHALMIVGISLHAVLAAQLGFWMSGAILPPLLPLGTPLFAALFFGQEMLSRLRRRGAEGPTSVVHRRLLVEAGAAATLVIGAWAAGEMVLLGWSPTEVLTRTSGCTFSAAPRP